MSSHHEQIRSQFTLQAEPFGASAAIQVAASLELVVELTGAKPEDTMLDMASGPGLLVCEFARVVRHAAGIDLTPAMLRQALQEADRRGLANVAWHLGDLMQTPFADGAFDIVTARFALHHLEDPSGALAEMTRVCAPGGVVAVIDNAPAPEHADAYNAMEILRDPSHVRAMPVTEIEQLVAGAGLRRQTTTRYFIESDLDTLLARSFPEPGDEPRIRALFEAAIVDDRLGLSTRRAAGTIEYRNPVAVVTGTRDHLESGSI